MYVACFQCVCNHNTAGPSTNDNGDEDGVEDDQDENSENNDEGDTEDENDSTQDETENENADGEGDETGSENENADDEEGDEQGENEDEGADDIGDELFGRLDDEYAQSEPGACDNPDRLQRLYQSLDFTTPCISQSNCSIPGECCVSKYCLCKVYNPDENDECVPDV